MSDPLEAYTSLISEGKAAALAVGSFSVDVDPNTASFDIFRNKSGDFLVHGENRLSEYQGVMEKDQSDYCVGYYNPKTKKLRLVPTPTVTMSSVVKSKKKARGPAIKQLNTRYAVLRNNLGEAFGTKKAKKAITDVERNRLDAGKLEDLESAIVESVATTTDKLPTAVERAEKMSQERPIPPYNMQATVPEDIYAFSNGIITEEEYENIRDIVTSKLIKSGIDKDNILTEESLVESVFPAHIPTYFLKRIQKAYGQLSKSMRIVKLSEIYYASLLLAIYQNRRASNKMVLLAKLGNSPADILVTNIIERFTISRTGLHSTARAREKSFAIDPAHENKLLCYLLVMILRIDNYTVEVSPLAQELSISPSRLTELFKALGCTIKPPTVGQAEALGIERGHISSYKIATLKVPFKLPEVVRRVRGGR